MSALVFILAVTAILTGQNGTAVPAATPINPPQTNTTGIPSVEVPRSAGDILKLASEMNGLDVPSAKPWHVKVSWDEFDEDGDNAHSGTLEEFRLGPKKYKRIYSSDTVSHTDIANEQGLFRSGDQSWPGVIETEIVNVVLRPLYRARWDHRNLRPEKTKLKNGAPNFLCAELRSTDPHNLQLGAPSFCFEPNTVMLRFTQGGFEATTYASIVPFQGHYVAKEIIVTHGDKPYLKLHVEQLEEITQASDSLFAPPPNSRGPLGGRISVLSGSYMEEYQLSSAGPVYPRGIGGTVHVNFVVGKDGRVIEATASDGPESMRKAALEAMRKYRFQPYLILDQPVEVESSMVFDLH
jgi:TonB family protein